jgi:predicted DNA-binding ribbon-helix-helix protein
VAAIDSAQRHGNLSSAIRLFVLDFDRNQLADIKAASSAKAPSAVKSALL